jgi:CheY-like chemotaxis protein
VQDTGLGIPPEEQGEVFNAFRRSERSVSIGLPGLGLGLTICKMIVRMHEGTIDLKSTGIEGEGSTFIIKIPTVKLPIVEIPHHAGEPIKSNKSVLLLTSRPGSNVGLYESLKKHGIKIHEAAIEESEIWLAKLTDLAPDVIVLDVTNQSELTWRTLNTIKANELTRGIPTMLYASTESKESLLRLDYLTKPFALEELTRALDQHWDTINPHKQIRTILVVDDEPNTLDLYARIVKSHSTANKVLLVNNGAQAIEIIRNKKIDLVLLDLQMPEMDGFDVIEAMREEKRTSKVPVIVLTGMVLTQEEMDRLNQGVAVILQKGLFSMEETIDHIETTLDQKQKLSSETQILIRQAMAYIHEHYRESISRKDIAQHINISNDYLTYCFRQELKTTPIRYIQRYRINLAKSLLKDTQKSITEIALDVGFSDSGYFSRIFHRETGVSPDQFRHLYNSPGRDYIF